MLVPWPQSRKCFPKNGNILKVRERVFWAIIIMLNSVFTCYFMLPLPHHVSTIEHVALSYEHNFLKMFS